MRAIERRFHLPIVCFDNVVEGVGAGRVTLANEAGIAAARRASRRRVHGHRRIGYVGGIESETSGAERLAGYEIGMLGNGLPDRSALGPAGRLDRSRRSCRDGRAPRPSTSR